MAEPIVYIDSSEIRAGKLDEVKAAIRGLVAFVAANEPQLVSYNIYLGEHDTRMAVVAVHPDAASMELHLRIGGPEFRKFAELITLQTIDIYGEPNEAVLNQLREKAAMLGKETVRVHTLCAGFSRFAAL